MTTISERAAQIRKTEEEIKQKQLADQKAETDLVKTRLLKEFEIAFEPVLQMLKTENITYSAHYQDERYFHMGTYILFKTDRDELKMDFNSANSYRYEFIKYDRGYGSMCYGKWDMDRFIIWIDEKLINGAGSTLAKKGLHFEAGKITFPNT